MHGEKREKGEKQNTRLLLRQRLEQKFSLKMPRRASMLDVANAAAADQSMHTLMFTPEHSDSHDPDPTPTPHVLRASLFTGEETAHMSEGSDQDVPAHYVPSRSSQRVRSPLASRTTPLASVYEEPDKPPLGIHSGLSITFSDFDSESFPVGEPSNQQECGETQASRAQSSSPGVGGAFHVGETDFTPRLESCARFSSFKAPRRSTLAVARQLGTVL